MTISRRDFLRTTSIALGAMAIPSWAYSADLTSKPLPVFDKSKLADAALSLAKKVRASYADIRINKYRIESISTREKQVQSVAKGQNYGFGVTVFCIKEHGVLRQVRSLQLTKLRVLRKRQLISLRQTQFFKQN